MPNQRARGKSQVSAWVPENQAAVLKSAADALGIPLSDVVARLVERFGPEVAAEMLAEGADGRGETKKGKPC